jgi:hypothetical protein
MMIMMTMMMMVWLPPAVMLRSTGVTVVLQWCYSGVTVVLQWCYSGVTVVLQWCQSGVTVVLQWYYSAVTVVLQWCYSGVTVVLQWCYSGVTVVLPPAVVPRSTGGSDSVTPPRNPLAACTVEESVGGKRQCSNPCCHAVMLSYG